MSTTTISKPWFLLFVLILFLFCNPCFSIGSDTLSPGQSLSASLNNQTLISQGENFELGFFTIGVSNIYLGIWYKNFVHQTIVWVANRDEPVDLSSSSRLEISEDGNLVLLNKFETPVWSTNVTFLTRNSTEAVLLDDGNFVLRDGSNPSAVFWQSFDYPTDTWLPGAKLGVNKVTGKSQLLTSWKNSEDPKPGVFSVGIDPNGSSQFFALWNKSQRYWSSGIWNGEYFSSVPGMRLNSIFNYSFYSDGNESYFTYSVNNASIVPRIVMDSSGLAELLAWFDGFQKWNVFWSHPTQQSDIYALCGSFGLYVVNVSCGCLQGFEPFSINDTTLNDWTSGCVRKTPLRCENRTLSNGNEDRFLKILSRRLPSNSKSFAAANAQSCELACLENCSCTAYAFNSSGCSVWDGALLNLQLLEDNSTGQDLYLRLAASELPSSGGNKKLRVIIAVSVSLAVVISSFFIYYLCRRMLKRKEKDSSEDLLLFDFDTTINATADEPNAESNLREAEKKDAELPSFSFASVSAATGDFSQANKLGEGGFGPVYKGKLLRGQEVAVKRLSNESRQGLKEFRNETVLIAKLQHKNLVRLLGRCIERDEYILIYEYMLNKSLDLILFDPDEQMKLDWETRIRIVEGIAQGLLYLHQYSRVQIIHRDLKASNILLDGEMNPKISDFGMARIFRGNDSQAITDRIMGTYGYMAPEYAMDGLFSVKSDVFSFGVLLLEILSGKRNTAIYQSDSVNLVGYAWELWNADRVLDLMDLKLDYPSISVLMRYINIALLCVQENPADRPTMSNVISMLSNEFATLPTPKQPAFTITRGGMDSISSRSSAGIASVNAVTTSMVGAR